MAWTNLPTNFINLVWSGLKKYRQYNNPDSTVSFEDVTEYDETEGTQMSAAQLNQMTGAINDLMTGIAEEFSTSTYYYIGDYCMYEGQLYRFTSNHSGAWNSSHVTAVSKITNEMRADNNPVNNSSKLVRSGGVYTALAGKIGDAPSDNKEYVRKNGAWSESSGGGGGGTWGSITGTMSNQTDLQSALDGKQGTLTFDTTPTANSTNPVTSGGIKTALDAKQNTLSWDTAPASGGTNPMKSGAIYNYKPFKVRGNASAGSSVTFTDSRIDSDHWQVKENGIYFGTGANVTTGVHWVTNPTNHTITLQATFTGATTVVIDMEWFQ